MESRLPRSSMRALLGRLLALQASAMRIRTPRHAVIYVDPCEDPHELDARLQLTADECAARGVHFQTVWSEASVCSLCAESGTTDAEAAEYRAQLAPEAGKAAAWCESVLPAGCKVIGVCCGSDAGLGCAERLLHVLVPERSNGLLAARRDKFEQHEALRACGLDAARQAAATEGEEAAHFLSGLPEPLRVVVKPRRGQGSARVGLARSPTEAETLFGRVLELPASLDEQAYVSSVLLQERRRALLCRAVTLLCRAVALLCRAVTLCTVHCALLPAAPRCIAACCRIAAAGATGGRGVGGRHCEPRRRSQGAPA